MIELKIAPDRYIELVKKGYSLDIILLLKLIEEEYDLIYAPPPKIENTIKILLRKGLITEDLKITLDGKSLLDFFKEGNEEVKIKKTKLKQEDFDLWWACFPSNDSFMYKGKKFTGCRGLRSDKEGCKLKFKSILNTGEFTAEEIIRSTKYDVFMKKENSYKTGLNKLSYLQNSKTYLNQLSFSAFIEESKNFEEKEVSTVINGMDI